MGIKKNYVGKLNYEFSLLYSNLSYSQFKENKDKDKNITAESGFVVLIAYLSIIVTS